MNSTEKDVVHIKSISKYKISWKAYFILFAGLAITILLSLQSYRYTHKMAVEEFTTVCNEIEHKITARLHAHALVLRAGAAYFSVSDTVSRNEWKIFIDRTKIDKNLPGILGVGFSLIIPAGQLNNHISRIRMEG
ncbi:MAG: CHASE domain-containing protein, partial [Bacteroidales bacterium]|nr:CHASE domain-containing protein [Bacteroidales bacterium]